jgi:hypothetical protein
MGSVAPSVASVARAVASTKSPINRELAWREMVHGSIASTREEQPPDVGFDNLPGQRPTR